jgi:predicted dienelactone hydrolase
MRNARQLRLWTAFAAICLLAGGALAAPMSEYPQDYRLGAFVLPKPEGRYAVGTLSFVVPVADAGPLRVIAWYPAQAASGPGAPYLDAAEQRVQAPAIARNFGLPPGSLSAVVALPTHSHPGARIAPGRFPLLIFSHGYFSYPRENTALMEHLASNGWIVLSLAHPGDAADIPTDAGVIPTIPFKGQRQPENAKLRAFWHGRDHRARVKALPGFWDALSGTRMLVSLDSWRGDIMHLADAVESRRVPREVLPIVQAADLHRLAYAGWSFGGSTSASACDIDRRCRAAVNMDGFEFDQHLYNHQMRMPLMLIQTDWTAYPNMGPPSRDYTVYDYAYERWRDAGSTPSIYRFRIAGARHLGLTDLALAPPDSVRDRIFGPANGDVVTKEVNSLVEAFLDRYVAGKSADVLAVAAAYPGVKRHQAVEIARWERDRRIATNGK